MKTINLKTGRFVYELGVQKMYESVDEILEDYPHYWGGVRYFPIGNGIVGYVRMNHFTEEKPVFAIISKYNDEFEILD